ncbi:acyltransferase [Verrucomicrobium sp. BvORR106]|uniref:acyltransferase family protein n=1 Tax=Verrucomicrobium sp. BvORR106 TaxID=1403819 RepID=UPI00057029AC|nr:acyltransferase [Verrucomicrobium sp. BvORR106]
MISPSSQRNLMLDVIRAFAVLIVLVHHIDGNLSVTRAEQAAFAPFAPLFVPGWVGVPIFFVLSGFLIGSLLIQEQVRTGSVNVGRFLIRRGFKIYPPFYILLAGYILLLVAGSSRPDPERLLREVFFLQNYGSGGLMDVTWSLAVEEHFYFLFAALVWLSLRRRTKVAAEGGSQVSTAGVFGFLPWLAAGFALICLVLRIVEFSAYVPGSLDNTMKNTHHRIDALFIGAALAYLHWRGTTWRLLNRPVWKAAAIILTLTTFVLVAISGNSGFERFHKVTWLYLLVSLATSYVVYLALVWQGHSNAVLKGLASVGTASYCIYLVHIPVYRVVAKLPFFQSLPFPLAGKIFCGLALSIVTGFVMTRLVETPFLRLRNRLFPTSTSALSPAVPPGTPPLQSPPSPEPPPNQIT